LIAALGVRGHIEAFAQTGQKRRAKKVWKKTELEAQ
jgi:hypothetical protein